MTSLRLPHQDSRHTFLLSALFMGSGCAALIYEVVWFHVLRLAIGSSAISLAILLASFMGGLFLGSLFFARFVPARMHPLRVYAVLELAIALCAVLLPEVLPVVARMYVANSGYGAANILMRATICAAFILPPTIMMGATLPAIARWMGATREGTAKVGFFYGANTFGAVIGTMLAGFVLLRLYDIVIATFVAVAINVLIAWIGFSLARRFPYSNPEVDGALSVVGAPAIVYWVIGISGFTALGAQVVWTRLMSLLFGATVYTFSIILSVFLVGLGIGSAIGSLFARTSTSPRTALGTTQLLLVMAIPYAAYVIKRVIPFVNLPGLGAEMPFIDEALQNQYSTEWVFYSINDFFRCALAILPATVLWGASFPLALAAARSDHDPGRVVGRVYAANTVGAIAGSLFFSLIAIPTLGTLIAEQMMTLLSAGAAILLFSRIFGQVRGRVETAIAAAALLVVAALLIYLIPVQDPGMIAYGRRVQSWRKPAEYLHTDEGMSASVGVSRDSEGVLSFHVSGKVVASGYPDDMRLQRTLGHLPALYHENPRTALVVGFGAGVTAGSLVAHPAIERIVIVEIEPAVPAASGVYFKEENFDVLNDPRVEVIFDDARHYLATTSERFDLITADPIHPWVKGAAALYSQEFFELTKARLNPGGIAAQWIPLYETSEAAVKSEIATFLTVFPDATLWNTDRPGSGYDIVIVGGIPLEQIDFRRINDALFDVPKLGASLREVGINGSIDILKSYSGRGSDMSDWLEDAQLNRDRSLRLEYLAGAALDRRVEDAIYSRMIAGIEYPAGLYRLVPGDESRYRQWFERQFGETRH